MIAVTAKLAALDKPVTLSALNAACTCAAVAVMASAAVVYVLAPTLNDSVNVPPACVFASVTFWIADTACVVGVRVTDEPSWLVLTVTATPVWLLTSIGATFWYESAPVKSIKYFG